ncbi:MAG: HepT-like ribonuclease domain-containing protein [Candidatus Acidiferrales bacterium]
MLEHAREAVTLVKARRREELDSDQLLNLALVRLVEIVGEAAARVPKESWPAFPQIPWAQIVSLRNRLIHGLTRSISISCGRLSLAICPIWFPRLNRSSLREKNASLLRPGISSAGLTPGRMALQ